MTSALRGFFGFPARGADNPQEAAQARPQAIGWAALATALLPRPWPRVASATAAAPGVLSSRVVV